MNGLQIVLIGIVVQMLIGGVTICIIVGTLRGQLKRLTKEVEKLNGTTATHSAWIIHHLETSHGVKSNDIQNIITKSIPDIPVPGK